MQRRAFVIGLVALACDKTAPPPAQPEPTTEPAPQPDARAAQPVRIVLVRHAEKQTEPKVDNPPLTEAGAARAAALVAAIPATEVRAILSTDTLRTTGTAQPVADAAGLTIQHMQPMDADLIRSTAAALDDGIVLVVGHSNTVPKLIEALCGDATVDLSDGAYGDLFTVTLDPGKLERGHFGD